MTTRSTWHEATHDAHLATLIGGVAAIGISVAGVVNESLVDTLAPAKTVAMWLYMVSLYVMVFHKPYRCRHCTNQFPPDDADTAACVTYRPRMRGFHRLLALTGKPWKMTVAIVLMVAFMMLMPSPWGLVVSIPVVLWINLRFTRTHMQLYPWCPFCHGPDDDDESVDDHDPAPGKTTKGI